MAHTQRDKHDPALSSVKEQVASLLSEACSSRGERNATITFGGHVAKSIRVSASVTGKGSPRSAVVSVVKVGKTAQPLLSITRTNGAKPERVPGSAAFGIKEQRNIRFNTVKGDDDQVVAHKGDINSLALTFARALLRRCRTEERRSNGIRERKLGRTDRRERRDRTLVTSGS